MDYLKTAQTSLNICQRSDTRRRRVDSIYDCMFLNILLALEPRYNSLDPQTLTVKNKFVDFSVEPEFSGHARFECIKSALELATKYQKLRELCISSPSPSREEKLEKYRIYCQRQVNMLMRRNVASL